MLAVHQGQKDVAYWTLRADTSWCMG